MTILITGARAPLGSAVVRELSTSANRIRGLGRGPDPDIAGIEWARGDLLSGEGLSAALHGVEAIVHCASNPFEPKEDLVAIDRLLAQSKDAAPGVRLVYAGISGIDKAAKKHAYYGAKFEVEQRIRASGLPFSIVRATQFHAFIEALLKPLDKGSCVVVPKGVRLQPIDHQVMAAHLADAARRRSKVEFVELHGPESLEFSQLAQQWLAADGRTDPVMSEEMPTSFFAAFADLQPLDGAGEGVSWSAWLRGARHSQGNPYLART